jgi:hypothetical protein
LSNNEPTYKQFKVFPKKATQTKRIKNGNTTVVVLAKTNGFGRYFSRCKTRSQKCSLTTNAQNRRKIIRILEQNSSISQIIKTNLNILEGGNKNGKRRSNVRRVKEN